MRTVEEMKQVFCYNPVTGDITYRVKRGEKNPGDVAGKPCKEGYLRFCYKDRMYSCHRLAWALYYGEWPKHTIDHINKDPSDNRICNLRDVPQWINNLNKRKYNTANKYRGVIFKQGLYHTRITLHGKTKSLGYYKCPIEAAKVYDREAVKLHGEHAQLNFPT